MKQLFISLVMFFALLQLAQAQPVPQDTSDIVWQIYNNRFITKIIFSNDSKQILTCTYDIVNNQHINYVEIRDVLDGSLIQELPGETDCVFSRDGTLLVTNFNDSILIREYPSLNLVKKIISDGSDGTYDFSPDNKFLASAAYNNGIRIFDIDSAKLIKEIKNFPFKWDPKTGGGPRGYYVKYNQNGTKLLFSGDWAFIYDLSLDTVLHQFPFSKLPKYSPSFNQISIIQMKPAEIYIYNAETYQQEKLISIGDSNYFDYVFSADENYIFTASGNQKMQVWDLTTLENIYTFIYDPPGTIGHIAASNDSNYIAIESGYLTLLNAKNIVGVEFYDLQKTPIVYPNPTTGIIKLEFNLPKNEIVKFNISDNSGKIIKFIDFGFHDEGKNDFKYNVSNLASGIYYLTIQGDSFLQTFKLVKE